MAHWAKDVTELIGRTPIVELKRVASGLDATVLAKLEMFSPGCSIKDRVAWQMICEAESQGLLRPGGVITEPTSGNMGVSLAWIAAARGYQCILTMRSEEHTSELQSQSNLVCRLLLEKKK